MFTMKNMKGMKKGLTQSRQERKEISPLRLKGLKGDEWRRSKEVKG